MGNIYREFIESLSRGSLGGGNWQNASLQSRKWNCFVLMRYKEDDNRITEINGLLIKAVALIDKVPSDRDKWNELITPSLATASLNATSDYVFDPFGVSILSATSSVNATSNANATSSVNATSYYSVLLSDNYLNLLPKDQNFMQTYSWKIDEKRWDLIGSLPLVPPSEVGGICWGGEYLESYYLSAVKFPEGIREYLILTMRIGVVLAELNQKKTSSNGLFEFNINRYSFDKITFKFQNGLDNSEFTIEKSNGSNRNQLITCHDGKKIISINGDNGYKIALLRYVNQ